MCSSNDESQWALLNAHGCPFYSKTRYLVPVQSDAMAKDTDAEKGVTVREFLERVAPGTTTKIKDFEAIPYYESADSTPSGYKVDLPEIALYCDSPDCGGTRFFEPFEPLTVIHLFYDGIVLFNCKNCQCNPKQYALRLHLHKEDTLHPYRKGLFGLGASSPAASGNPGCGSPQGRE